MPHFSHFMPGTMVYVTNDTDDANRLRELPGTRATELGRLPPRTVVEVLGGPAYNDGHIYWQVREPATERVGWTSQGCDKEVYLRAVIEQVVCPGLPTSLLQRGDRAMVALRPSDPSTTRASPGTESDVVGEIPPGAELTVLDGPACMEESVWWEVKTDYGLRGWVAEGRDLARWILPVRVGYS